MASPSCSDVVSVAEHEFSCPVCLDLFEEPKCLPNCAHNVCQHCLEEMGKKKTATIECPVCRVESVIPKDGVAAFPKNHLLVRLIEQTPGRKEKQSIKEAVKNCSEKLEGAKAAVERMEGRFSYAKSHAEETKQRIRTLAEHVVTMVREQEQTMLGEIDQKCLNQTEGQLFERQKFTAMALCENASGCIETVQDILQNGELSDLKDLKDALVEELDEFSKNLEKRELEVDFTQSIDVLLTDTGSVEKFIEEGCLLGKLVNTGNCTCTSSTPQDVTSVWDAASVYTPRNIDYSRCGSLIQTIDSSSCEIAKFTPFSVAISRVTGHFVVLDEEMKRVHIFNEEGEVLHTFRIMYGDLWDIAVSNENEIIVVNRESNRLLHYDINGNFQRKYVTAPKENVKFTSLSVDVSGRFIITSHPFYSETEDDTLPRILVYTPLGVFTTSFGEGTLSSPEKAVFLNGKFFVADSGRESVVIFDRNGEFLEEFGIGQVECPSSIAADYNSGNLLVSDRGNSTMHIYSQDGQLLHHFKTEHAPVHVAFTKSYENLLVCCEVDDNKKNIQMMTYS